MNGRTRVLWDKSKTAVMTFVHAFQKHDVMTMSAALAFYTALALAPLLMLILALVGVLGDNSQARLLTEIKGLIGAQAAEAVRVVIDNAENKPDAGSLAGVLGTCVLLFSASTIFAQIQTSLNVIWDAEGEEPSGLWIWLRKRLLSMGMVLSLGFVAMVSLLVSSALTFFAGREGWLWGTLNWVSSIVVFTLLFAAIFKYLPDIKPRWKIAFVGGAITAVLFAGGKSLIGLYLGRSALGSSYGAAGSLIVLLAWVYYSAIILFTGAELTSVMTPVDQMDD